MKLSKEKLQQVQKEFYKELQKINPRPDELEKLKNKYLGRKSFFNSLMKELKNLSKEDKKELGSLANQVKEEIRNSLEKTKQKLKEKEMDNKSNLDVTAPGKKRHIGHLNVLSQTQRKIESIFVSMGFEIADGPEIENEWYNFDALNIPSDHPARDLWDTFWIKQEATLKNGQKSKLLARTHTSNAQVRYMEKNKPPFKIVIPGKAYRYEATDANHEHSFGQFEALVVGYEVNTANFKDIAEKFFSAYFEQDTEIRLRPSYFPFTEPSFEFDISCTVCKGKGCSTCKESGWLEIGGCGMVNQRVFQAAGYPKNKYQGFAWGFGLERLALMKHRISDIRFFRSGDLRFTRQF
jgi:phenylalanyl-tRNA synthetase alpha chain